MYFAFVCTYQGKDCFNSFFFFGGGGGVCQPAAADQVVLSGVAISPKWGATFSELIFNSFRIIAHKEVDHPIPVYLIHLF